MQHMQCLSTILFLCAIDCGTFGGGRFGQRAISGQRALCVFPLFQQAQKAGHGPFEKPQAPESNYVQALGSFKQLIICHSSRPLTYSSDACLRLLIWRRSSYTACCFALFHRALALTDSTPPYLRISNGLSCLAAPDMHVWLHRMWVISLCYVSSCFDTSCGTCGSDKNGSALVRQSHGPSVARYPCVDTRINDRRGTCTSTSLP